MIPWLFDPQPVVEWRFSERAETDPPPAGHIYSFPALGTRGDRFPRNELIHYREYHDFHGRFSVMAFLRCGEDAGPCANLVEECWEKAIPVVVWFERPPRKGWSQYREVMRPRSIESVECGRLVWRPILAWNCESERQGGSSLMAWLNRQDPLFQPPIVRFAFGEQLTPQGAGQVLRRFRSTPLPCWFKIFSLPWRGRETLRELGWETYLDDLARLQRDMQRRDQVITLPVASRSNTENLAP